MFKSRIKKNKVLIFDFKEKKLRSKLEIKKNKVLIFDFKQKKLRSFSSVFFT